MAFDPVSSLADLQSLDEKEILDGYLSAERGDPEPGENRGRAFWHGWRCRMMDLNQIQADDTHRQLVREYVGRNRAASIEPQVLVAHANESCEPER